MFVSTAVNLLFIPGLYVLVQKLRNWRAAPAKEEATAQLFLLSLLRREREVSE